MIIHNEHTGCHVCLDYVSNLGDISTGSVGSPDGWSTSLSAPRRGMMSGPGRLLLAYSRQNLSKRSSLVLSQSPSIE